MRAPWQLRVLALFLLVFCGCATEPLRADKEPPTYGQCLEECALACEHNDCRKSGQRPIGTRDGECECGPWDA